MNNLFSFIMDRLSQFGQIPMCNGIAERAPHIFGFCFPLCYRCTFILLICAITLWICYKRQIHIHPMILIVCLIPMIIDGGLQTFFGIMSDNLRRVLTGSLFGFGIGALIAQIYSYLDNHSTFSFQMKR